MNIVLKCGQDDVELTVERLEHANINPKTMLATDYLNHFNEMIMLIDMLDSMPQCADDILAWHPKGYRQHFRESVFAEKALAITAYDRAPETTRRVKKRQSQR